MYCIECFQYARPAELDVSVRRRAIMAGRESVVKYLERRPAEAFRTYRDVTKKKYALIARPMPITNARTFRGSAFCA
jgi:hypothetical protein